MERPPAPLGRGSDRQRTNGYTVLNIHHRRYCLTPFPPYRYVPGAHPHPIAHPQGHSHRPHGSPHPIVQHVPPDRWRDSEDYLYGCDLYNHAFWWEAHEAWEGLWQTCDKKSTQGRFLQGLIQAAACHLKLHMKSQAGVERLRPSSLGYLKGAAEEIPAARYMGLDLPGFIVALQAYFDARIESGGRMEGHDPAVYPYLILDI